MPTAREETGTKVEGHIRREDSGQTNALGIHRTRSRALLAGHTPVDTLHTNWSNIE